MHAPDALEPRCIVQDIILLQPLREFMRPRQLWSQGRAESDEAIQEI